MALSGSLERINNNGNFENGESSFKNLGTDLAGSLLSIQKNAFIRFVLLNQEEKKKKKKKKKEEEEEEKNNLTCTIGGGMNDEELRKNFGRQ
jgi:hypothetical protein